MSFAIYLHYRNVYLIATDTRTIEIWKREFEEGKEIEEAEVITENKKSLTYGEVKDDENKNLIDDNIIPQEEENYASDFMEDDIETKNKKLMEQEKLYIPSFGMRWN